MDKENKKDITHLISDFLYEEEANISRKKIISVGAMLALATILMTTDAFARHSSHSSHGSHGSHSSHVSGSGHSSHASSTHGNHASSAHVSHASSAHANHASSAHANHASSSHGSHASHSSAYIQHSSHASSTNSYYPSHSNVGSSEFIPEPDIPQYGSDIPSLDNVPEDMIDIREPLIPPKSPPSNTFRG